VRQGEYSWDSLKLLAATQQVPTGSRRLPTVDSLFQRLSSYFGCDTENQMYLGAHACEQEARSRMLVRKGDHRAILATLERADRFVQRSHAGKGGRYAMKETETFVCWK
jgi:hypothetical protein